jgi:hypothetical protein
MAFSMTFEGADDSAYSTGVVTLVVSVSGCDTPLNLEGDEQTAWDHRKGKAAIMRRVLRVYWQPATVAEGGAMDHGYYEAFQVLCRKQFKRITETDLPRVTRIFEGGELSEPFSLWEGREAAPLEEPPIEAVAGLLPFEFELSSATLPKYSNGQYSVTAELFAPNVEAM